MEVLQALVLKANLDAGTAEPSPVLAQVFGNIPKMAGFCLRRKCHPEIGNNVKYSR